MQSVECSEVVIFMCSTAGTVALITINSGAQIHPLIATRWCSSLKGKNLRYVMVANHGYLQNKVNFAARIAKNRVNPEVPVDLIASFKAAAATDPGNSRIDGVVCIYTRLCRSDEFFLSHRQYCMYQALSTLCIPKQSCLNIWLCWTAGMHAYANPEEAGQSMVVESNPITFVCLQVSAQQVAKKSQSATCTVQTVHRILSCMGADCRTVSDSG